MIFFHRLTNRLRAISHHLQRFYWRFPSVLGFLSICQLILTSTLYRYIYDIFQSCLKTKFLQPLFIILYFNFFFRALCLMFIRRQFSCFFKELYTSYIIECLIAQSCGRYNIAVILLLYIGHCKDYILMISLILLICQMINMGVNFLKIF